MAAVAAMVGRTPRWVVNRVRLCGLAEVWRELSGITVAKLEVRGKTHLKLSHLPPYAQQLLTLCRVPCLDTILSE